MAITVWGVSTVPILRNELLGKYSYTFLYNLHLKSRQCVFYFDMEVRFQELPFKDLQKLTYKISTLVKHLPEGIKDIDLLGHHMILRGLVKPL